MAKHGLNLAELVRLLFQVRLRRCSQLLSYYSDTRSHMEIVKSLFLGIGWLASAPSRTCISRCIASFRHQQRSV